MKMSGCSSNCVKDCTEMVWPLTCCPDEGAVHLYWDDGVRQFPQVLLEGTSYTVHIVGRQVQLTCVTCNITKIAT